MTTQLVMSRHCESLGGLALSVQHTSSEELNPFEMEIVSKFDNIISVLKELEEQFSQARQEVLRKSSLEGKESGKIFAIKGRVITNKKKYYKSLEGDIQTLAKVFSDQWNKVLRDFTSLKVVSGLEEKTGAELTPSKDMAVFTPILNSHAAEPHGQDIVASSPFVKSVALPSLKRVETGKKPTCMGLSTPIQRPLFKASSTTDVEIPKKLDFDRGAESIPNPYASRMLRREQLQQQADVLQIPEDPEGEEISRGAVSRVRLGLLNEIRSSETISAPKSVRTIKGHGFKITQTTPPKESREVTREQLNRSPFEANDKCTI